MIQFDVFRNPIAASRSIYPFVINLQSNISRGPCLQIVAPLTRQVTSAAMTRNLMPDVKVGEEPYTVIMAQITTLRLDSVGGVVASGESARAPILAAIDLLFFGI